MIVFVAVYMLAWLIVAWRCWRDIRRARRWIVARLEMSAFLASGIVPVVAIGDDVFEAEGRPVMRFDDVAAPDGPA